MLVQWEPPPLMNGVLRFYYVHFNSKSLKVEAANTQVWQFATKRGQLIYLVVSELYKSYFETIFSLAEILVPFLN